MHGKSSEIHIFVEKIILFKFLLYPPTYVFIGFFCHLPEHLKINLVSSYRFFLIDFFSSFFVLIFYLFIYLILSYLKLLILSYLQSAPSYIILSYKAGDDYIC